MSKCIYCKDEFKEGDMLQAFLRSPDDTQGSWTNPVEVDKDYQKRSKINNDKIKRKHIHCNEPQELGNPETNVFVPDYKYNCCNCDSIPTVKIETESGEEVTHMEMCGPCTFGTAKALNVDEWNTQEDW